MIVRTSRVELHDVGGVCHRFNSRQGKNDADEPFPIFRQVAGKRFQVVQGLVQVEQTEYPKADHHNRRRNRDCDRQSAGMLGPEIVQSANGKDRRSCKQFGLADAKVLKSGKSTNRCRHDVIGDQKEGTRRWREPQNGDARSRKRRRRPDSAGKQSCN